MPIRFHSQLVKWNLKKMLGASDNNGPSKKGGRREEVITDGRTYGVKGFILPHRLEKPFRILLQSTSAYYLNVKCAVKKPEK